MLILFEDVIIQNTVSVTEHCISYSNVRESHQSEMVKRKTFIIQGFKIKFVLKNSSNSLQEIMITSSLSLSEIQNYHLIVNTV